MSLTTTALQEMEAIARRIKRETADEQSAGYAFSSDKEPWNATLQRLPYSCLLWTRFLAFDTQRKAYDAETQRRERWLQELRTINRRRVAVDPDTADLATFQAETSRKELLELALEQGLHAYKELKDKTERHRDTWGQFWEEYRKNEQQIAHIARQGDSRNPYDERPAHMRQLNERKRYYETPRELAQ